ncbi:enoyl-CoA hydratase/isomerase family protein [Cognatishimia activa]|uniref:enoyl-CoA hydratase/isomerase family protein n=1 Tax=Cognatishimia activa TaxID=1715691 RepID=UPI002232C6CD|nr:enoyl-CoA hydratase/isomerase family protein [Cognatishimia activa]UZD91683.1 enoyl-CoA hydratase-related protein [Cognatishimia activa]
MALLRSETQGSVCHIEMNDGRDNRLSRLMCFELSKSLQTAFEDKTVKIVLLTGAGSYFSAGYDLSSLSSDADQIALFHLIDLLTDAPKPVIAGIQGDAFGAGFEVALLCSFRLAASGVSFGFPDISHGLMPGAGATQTLPRILGAGASLDLLLDGLPVKSSELGPVVDAEIKGDFKSGAKRFAVSLAEENIGPLSIASRDEGLADPVAFQSALVDARAERANDPISESIINAVETALLLQFSSGIDVERELFKIAEARPKARAKRHLSFQRWRLKEDIRAQITPITQLGRIAVVGDGELAQNCVSRLLLSGRSVTAVLGDTLATDDFRFEVLDVARQVASTQESDIFHEAGLSDQLTISSELADCATADLVLDASEEERAGLLARALQLGDILPGHVVFTVASQELGIEPVELAFGRPAQFSKVWLEPDLYQESAVYSLSGENHSGTRALVLTLLNTFGLNGIETKQEAGFVSISMWLTLLQAAETLCLSGTPVSAIDAALSEKGFGDGPFRMAEELGLEVITQLASDVSGFKGDLKITRALADQERSEDSAEVGFYLSEDGRQGLPNPIATRVIQSLREDRGAKAEALEIQQYCLAVLANKAATMLAEEDIRCAGELDVILTEELGLSVDLGGPLHAADQEGLLHLRYLLTGEDGKETPSEALLDMIKNGLSFSALNAEVQRFS